MCDGGQARDVHDPEYVAPESSRGSVLDPPFLQAVAAITPEQRQQIIDGLGALLRAAGPAVSKEKAS